tara:strand:- start:319 stop:894 length:576 start_codon:yes stop_codon:yes gene_type:complete
MKNIYDKKYLKENFKNFLVYFLICFSIISFTLQFPIEYIKYSKITNYDKLNGFYFKDTSKDLFEKYFEIVEKIKKIHSDKKIRIYPGNNFNFILPADDIDSLNGPLWIDEGQTYSQNKYDINHMLNNLIAYSPHIIIYMPNRIDEHIFGQATKKYKKYLFDNYYTAYQNTNSERFDREIKVEIKVRKDINF